jgi:N-succinyldiaminopimelate aminotransferase
VNPHLDKLHPYPFEKLRHCSPASPPNPDGLAPISLGIGEPKHPTPAFIEKALAPAVAGLANYPSTSAASRCARRSPAGSSAATACRRSTRPRWCCR